MNKAVEGDDTELKQAVLKNSALSADVISGCVKSESIGSELITAIAERSDLNDASREIVDLKVKLSELRTQHQDDSGYAWLEESLLSITDWGKDVFEAIYRDNDAHIRSAVAKNPSLPEAMLSELIEDSEISVKLSALANSSCTKTILKKASENTENYSSSRIRKAVALNIKTPKAVLNKLLKDEYRWVREATASHPDMDTQAITKLIRTGDRYILKGLGDNPNCDKAAQEKINKLIEDAKKYPVEYSTYKIKQPDGRYGIVEDLGGSVSIDDMIKAIISGEDSWSDYIYSNFYDYEDTWHEYGPISLIDSVVYPDSSEESIDVKAEYRYPHKGKIEIGSSAIGSDIFFQTAQSYEKGSWIYNEFELENEFKPECLTAIYQDEAFTDGLVSYYEYEDPDTGESCEIEGELSSSSTSGTDITLYVNTDKGIQYIDLSDIRDRMLIQNLDSTKQNDVKKFLKNDDFLSKSDKRKTISGLLKDYDISLLRYASIELLADKEYIIELLNINWRAIEYASNDLKSDKEVIIKAIKQDWKAIEYASDDLKSDREVVIEAIKQDWKAIEYASDDLKDDQDNIFKDAEIDSLSTILEQIQSDEWEKGFEELNKINVSDEELKNVQKLTIIGGFEPLSAPSPILSLPPEIAKFKNLKELNIESRHWSRNKITTLPPEIGMLQNLELLNLNGNDLTILPPEISKLKKLKYLDLSANKFTALPPEIGNLDNLEILILNDNGLKSLPDEFEKLKKIKVLSIKHNHEIDGTAGDGHIWSLINFPIQICKLYTLEELNLDYNNSLSVIPPQIGKLVNLKTLILSSCAIDELPLEIGHLINLEVLDLGSHASVYGEYPDHNKSYEIIRDASNNRSIIIGEDDTFWPDNFLNKLPSKMKNLINLKKLILSQNNLSSKEKEKIKTYYPNTEIIW